MSCCRGTPEEYLAAKLLDIECFTNNELVKNTDKLIHFKSPVEFDVFSRAKETKIGSISFQRFGIEFEYLIHWKPNSEPKTLLCLIDVTKPSKKIASQIAKSLAQM